MPTKVITPENLGPDFTVDPSVPNGNVTVNIDDRTMFRDPVTGKITARARFVLGKYFPQSPNAGWDEYILNPEKLWFDLPDLAGGTFGNNPISDQVYKFYDGATEFASLTFHADGTATATMPTTPYKTTADFIRIIGPAAPDPLHEKFATQVNGWIL